MTAIARPPPRQPFTLPPVMGSARTPADGRRFALADRAVRRGAQGAGWLTLALLAGIIVSLVVGAGRRSAVRPVLPLAQRMGPGQERSAAW